ncbi:hypothetical protein PI124_g382 [Phytophthora idaei]|nr:hypothetical protein PI125_g1303 [Phytophthora idaei]KAG3170465.1 hypothetical protein PI126_g2318 [Phytophthora idaei]KAG3255087.1 hypothetical protein PI124_g382 [Phytophthora idaei]
MTGTSDEKRRREESKWRLEEAKQGEPSRVERVLHRDAERKRHEERMELEGVKARQRHEQMVMLLITLAGKK